MEAVLKTEPGSSRSLTALFFTSRYSPSLHLVILTMALISPVFTSMTIATPTLPLISLSSSMTERSAKSCMFTSMVVTMSAPSMAGFSVMLRYLFITFLRCTYPSFPRSVESNESSRPQRAVSLAPNMSPTVRWARVPNGRCLELNSSVWNPLLYFGRLKKGSFFTSV